MHLKWNATSWTIIATFVLVVAPVIFFSPSLRGSKVLAQEAMDGDRRSEAERLYQEGERLYTEGQYEAALKQLQQALEIYQELGEREAEALLFNAIGSTFDQMGQVAEALESYEQSLNTYRELGNRSFEASILRSIGATYGEHLQYEQALETFQEALRIYGDLGDRAGQVYTLQDIGWVHEELEQYSEMLEAFQESLEISREIEDDFSQWGNLLAIARIYSFIEQNDRAIETYQEALALSNRLGEVEGNPPWLREGLILAQLGRLHNRVGKYQEALGFLEQSLSTFRQKENSQLEGAVLRSIGQVYMAQQDYSSALEALRESLQIVEILGTPQSQARTLKSIGDVYYGLEDYSEALSYYQRGLIILEPFQIRSAEAEILSRIGDVMRSTDEPELAITFYKQAINLTESIRMDLQGLTLEDQESYIQTIAPTYRSLADLLLQQDRVLEAQQVLDLLKLQEVDDYLQNVRGEERLTQSLEYLQPEQQILELYNQAITQGQELAQLRQIPESDRTPDQQQRLAELVANQQDVTQSFNDFLNRPDVASAIQQLSLSSRGQNLGLEQLNALQDNLRNLNQNAVLLYPLILDDRLELVLVTPHSPPIRRTVAVTREDLNQAIVQFRSQLTSRTGDALPEAQQLYQWLIQPIEADLEQASAETILYAPDAQLRYIPLAALHDGDQWLVQRFRINSITAASLTDFDTLPQSDVKVLAGAFTEGTVSFQVGTREFSFSGLPFAGVEVNNIAAEIPDTTTLVNQAFSPQAIIPRMDDYTVVHLATHAEFVPGLPDESFILFGNGDRVTLQDISTWSLSNVDLVVLSACETAVGGELGNGEEILGLGYQVQRTGARAAVASLWSVDDGGTQVLMNAFYAALEQGMTKAEALRQAQIALITGDFTAVGSNRGTVEFISAHNESPPQVSAYLDNPYYWAPFILIGNGL